MTSQELKRAKRSVRASVLAARDALAPAERERLGVRIARRFLELPEVDRAETVMVFWSFGSEVPTQSLMTTLHTRGLVTALPRIRADALEVRSYVPGDPLTPTAFGAMEPAGGAQLDPQQLDVICVPGVAFDPQGRRIGYGGGFYDRFLPLTGSDAVRVAVAFEVQIVGADLPAGAFDRRVDVVVTESRVIRPGSRDLNGRSKMR